MTRIMRIIWLPVLLLTLACSLATSAVPTATVVVTGVVTEPATLEPQPTATPLPSLEGVIAYSSSGDGNWQIMVMNADGSSETSLTAGLGQFSRPSWSPDGTRIGMRIDLNGIAVMEVRRENGRLVGGPPVTITDAFADGPRWSPDGNRLVYVSTENSSGWRTYISDLSTVTTAGVPGIPENATNPDWSPQGDQIVFSIYDDPEKQVRDLFVINTDGSGLVQLTNTPTISEDEPIWSPDGEKVVFTASETNEQNITRDIYIMNRDGTNLVRVTTHAKWEFDPSWSPDGTKIIFATDRHDNNDGNYEIYLINADGTGELRLTNNHTTDRWPSWRAQQPDDVPAADCQPGITLVGDVTIPSGTQFASPQAFAKVWRVQNSGTCTWSPLGYSLRFVEGEQMSSVTQVMMPGAIQPGATVDLIVPQSAPEAPGRHTGVWQVFDRHGQAVPGADGRPVTLGVDIEVLAPGQDTLPHPLYFLSSESGSPQIWRMERDARTRAQITNEAQPVLSFDVSSSGQLAYVSENQVLVANASGQERRVVASLDPESFIFQVAWSPGGNRLAYHRQGIHVFDLSTGQDQLLIADTDTGMPGLVYYEPLQWSPDGSKLLAAALLWEGREIHMISAVDGAVLAVLPSETPAWNRDSQSVYLASSQYPGMIGIEPGLWRGVANGESVQALIQGASIWWPSQRADGSLAFFMHQPMAPETLEYSVLLYTSSAEGTDPVAVTSWPLLLNLSDRFRGLWARDGSSILVQLTRPALETSEVLLLSAENRPPLFLMPEIQDARWGP